MVDTDVDDFLYDLPRQTFQAWITTVEFQLAAQQLRRGTATGEDNNRRSPPTAIVEPRLILLRVAGWTGR